MGAFEKIRLVSGQALPCDSGAVSRWAFRLSAALLALPLWPQILVDTVAGGKVHSGVPAQDVALSFIDGIAWDGSGGLVFCEPSANLIRRIRPDGMVGTVAGNGVSGFSGDGGPAINATLHSPAKPRFDGKGNLYFVDRLNNRIRRIDKKGVTASVAGSGVYLQPGLDLEGPALERSLGSIIDLAADADGNVYFTEQDSDFVRRVTTTGRITIFAGAPHSDCPDCSDGDNGPALAARIVGAGLLALDGLGNLYVSETGFFGGTRIRRIAPDGTITKFAGYGTFTGAVVDDEGKPAMDAYLSEITSMTADDRGNVYIVQPRHEGPRNAPPIRIRRIDVSGTITTLAGEGALKSPYGLAVDARGNIAYAEDGMIRQVSAGSAPRTLAGGSPKAAPDGTPARDAWLLNPTGLAFNRTGDLFIAESGPCLIRKIGADGLLATAAGTGNCGHALAAQPSTTQDLAPPESVAIDSRDRLFFTDRFGNSYVLAPDGKVAPSGFPPVLGPGSKIAIDAKDRIYLLGTFSLVRILPDGTPQTIVGPPSQPGVPPPGFGPTSLLALGVDPSRNVYFTGSYIASPGNFVFSVNDNGTFARLYEGISGAWSLAADGAGNVWLSGGTVSVANASGEWSIGTQGGYSGDGGPAQAARFDTSAISLAPNGDLYIVDNNRIRRLTGLGTTKAPAIAPGGVVNALSYAGGAVAPGELVSIFGSNFGAADLEINAPQNNRIPPSTERTKVLFDDLPGAITAVTPNQVNVFVPHWLEPGKAVDVVVQVDDIASGPVSIPVVETAPGFFRGALNQDGSLNSGSNRAARGSIISLFGTGEGLSSPQLLTGEFVISTPFSAPVAPVAVTIGGQPAEVIYAGAAPFQPAGVLQINVRVPATAARGSAAVSVSVGGMTANRFVVGVR